MNRKVSIVDVLARFSIDLVSNDKSDFCYRYRELYVDYDLRLSRFIAGIDIPV